MLLWENNVVMYSKELYLIFNENWQETSTQCSLKYDRRIVMIVVGGHTLSNFRKWIKPIYFQEHLLLDQEQLKYKVVIQSL